jgi:hypothetical protein
MRLLGPTCVVVLLLSFAGVARAELVARPALDGIVLFHRHSEAPGASLGASLGYDLELEPLVLVPELTAGYALYTSEDSYSGLKKNGSAIRALAGMRVGWALGVEPSVFARAGYGNVTVSIPYGAHDSSFYAVAHGFALQAGAAVDYRLSRRVTVGGEVFYDQLSATAGYDRILGGAGDEEYRITVLGVGMGVTLGFSL